MPCKVFRVGVFFDGTGNNKINDKAGMSANGPSNIAKLSELYWDGKKLDCTAPDICKIQARKR